MSIVGPYGVGRGGLHREPHAEPRVAHEHHHQAMSARAGVPHGSPA